MKSLISAAGWYGVLALLGAYALASFEVLSPASATFQILNLTGAIAIVIEAFSKKDWQPGILNIAWSLVALFALLRLFL